MLPHLLERDTVSRIHLAIFLQLNLQMTYIDIIILISTIYYPPCFHPPPSAYRRFYRDWDISPYY